MSDSRSKTNRLRLAVEIQRNGFPSDFPCEYCCGHDRSCIIMPHAGRAKCSECVRRGKPCVSLSWGSLDRTREEYKKKVEEDEEKLAEVLARLLRNKKILRQAEERAAKKAECLSSEMEESGELEDCPAADALTSFSAALWTTEDFLNTAVDGLFDSGSTVVAAADSVPSP